MDSIRMALSITEGKVVRILQESQTISSIKEILALQ